MRQGPGQKRIHHLTNEQWPIQKALKKQNKTKPKKKQSKCFDIFHFLLVAPAYYSWYFQLFCIIMCTIFWKHRCDKWGARRHAERLRWWDAPFSQVRSPTSLWANNSRDLGFFLTRPSFHLRISSFLFFFSFWKVMAGFKIYKKKKMKRLKALTSISAFLHGDDNRPHTTMRRLKMWSSSSSFLKPLFNTS